MVSACFADRPPAHYPQIFLRELKPAVFDNIEKHEIMRIADTPGDKTEILDFIREPMRSLFLWVLDALVAVSKQSEVNKMTTTNLGKLFTTSS